MHDPVFEYDAFQTLITEFVRKTPAILARHSSTVDLAVRIERLLTLTETPFTIAVVGQMRVGKSSLLNALVGADLAVTGVNETTATINWFKHGTRDQESHFRVVWKDRPAEDFPLAEITNWVGDSERARATRYIEFFVDSEFLRQANIVDTPGTRSVIEAHEAAVQEFLTLKPELETRREAESADAIVYVVMPVARQSDADVLSDFEQSSRIPGSTPYNSLAVLHKWETLSSDDPYAQAVEKAGRVASAFKDHVSVVMPFSAPLAIASERFPLAFWDQVLELATNTNPEILQDLLLTEQEFRDVDEPECCLDLAARRSLRDQHRLPWPSFKVIIKTAIRTQASSGHKLKAQVGDMSGLQRLRQTLQQRFLDRSRMIKAFSVLSKAWDPCQIATLRLRNHKNRFARVLSDAKSCQQAVAKDVEKGAIHLEPVLSYLEETQQTIQDDIQIASENLRSLGESVVRIKTAFDDMSGDLRMLELVEQNHERLGEGLSRRLNGLFGYFGPTIANRVSQFAGHDASAVGLADLESGIEEIRTNYALASGECRDILQHAISRLEQIADVLEQGGTISATDAVTGAGR